MFDNKFVRRAGVLAFVAGIVVAGTGLGAGVAGAAGSTPAPFTIAVNGANSTAVTTSPTSTMTVVGLAAGATGTVEFDQAGSPLCTVTLPATSCTTATLAVGSYPGITGTYSGDGSFAGSTSTNAVNLTVLASGGPSLICSKVSGYVTKKITFSYCRVSQKGGHILGADLLTGGTMTWSISKTVTTYAGTGSSPGQGACHADHTELDFTGTVTADSSTFVTVGGPVSSQLCENTAGVVKFVPGTKATF